MSGKADQLSPALALARQRRKGWRVAIAVSIGFTFAVWIGAIIPFLGPLFAAQFLLSSSRPLGFGQTLGAAILIFVAGMFFMMLTTLFADSHITFLFLLGLIYFLCFFMQALGKGGAAIFLILIVAIIVPLIGVLNTELAGSILSILTTAVVTGTVLMWVAHLLVPEPAGEAPGALAAPVSSHRYWKASANTAILLSAVTVCMINDQLASAMVIPITVASMLGQLDIVASRGTAFGLIIVNVLGGVIASVAFAILDLRPNLAFMAVIVLVVALLLGGRAAAETREAKVFAGALTTFLILFGLGVSPIPGSAAESFSTRIIYVTGAIMYAFLLAALLWPRARPMEPAGAV
ncbi:DUF2955 domain-containing protein [Rhizobium sp. LjRoot254]|uniref:DUF2955 domain-containing protein n=1 Tax=Rhizobium sp. LjRoot254 TaxID=3342297 RepID=UPI003ED04038